MERTTQEFLLTKKEWITKQIQKQNSQVQATEEMGLLTDEEIRKIKRQAKKIIPERVAY